MKKLPIITKPIAAIAIIIFLLNQFSYAGADTYLVARRGFSHLRPAVTAEETARQLAIVMREKKLAQLVEELADCQQEEALLKKLDSIYELCDKLEDRSLPVLTIAFKKGLAKKVKIETYGKILERIIDKAKDTSYLQRAAYDALMQDYLRKIKKDPFKDVEEQRKSAFEIMKKIGEPVAPEIKEILCNPEWEEKLDLPIVMFDETEYSATGIRVISSTAEGASAGGERIVIGKSELEIERALRTDETLAAWMDLKAILLSCTGVAKDLRRKFAIRMLSRTGCPRELIKQAADLCMDSKTPKSEKKDRLKKMLSDAKEPDKLEKIIDLALILAEGVGGSKGVTAVPFDIDALPEEEQAYVKAQLYKGKGYQLAMRGILHPSRDKAAGDWRVDTPECDAMVEGALCAAFLLGWITNDELDIPFESAEQLLKLEQDPFSKPMLERYHGPFLAMVTGKTSPDKASGFRGYGGAIVRQDATGKGLHFSVEEFLEKMGEELVGVSSLEGMSVVIQGTGKVGRGLAKSLHKAVAAGVKIVCWADSKGATFNPDGLNIRELLIHMKTPQLIGGREMCSVVNFSGGRNITNEEALELGVDISAPSATEGVIHGENVAFIKAAIQLDGANGAATPEADAGLAKPFGKRQKSSYRHPPKPEWLKCERIITLENIPCFRLTGIGVNGGGLGGSWLEKVQNLLGESWEEDEGDRILKDLMCTLIDHIVDEYKELRKKIRDITFTQVCRILATKWLVQAISDRMERGDAIDFDEMPEGTKVDRDTLPQKLIFSNKASKETGFTERPPLDALFGQAA